MGGGGRQRHGGEQRPDRALDPEVGDRQVREGGPDSVDHQVAPAEDGGDDGRHPQWRARQGGPDAAEAEEGDRGQQHRDRRVDGALRPEAGDQHGERCDHGRGDQGTRCGQREQPERRRRHDRTDEADETGVAEVAEPAGVLCSDDVERDQAEADDAQRLTGHPQTATGEGPGTAEGDARQGEQDEGASAHAQPAPGHGQERDGRDQQAEGAERQQDPRHRRAAQPRCIEVGRPVVGAGTPGCGVRRRVGQERAGRGGGERPRPDRHRGHRGRLASESGQQQVRALEGGEELDRRGPGQWKGAASADLRRHGEQRVAVGAARRIGVRRHACQYLTHGVPVPSAAALRSPEYPGSGGLRPRPRRR